MKRRLNIEHILILSLFFMFLCASVSYGAFLLMQRGYTSSQAGIILSCGSIFSLLIQPVVANYIDANREKVTVLKAAIFTSSVALIAAIVSYFQRSRSILTIISFMMTSGCISCLEPLINSISYDFKENGYEVSFGIGRASGSLAYAGMSTLCGIISVRYEYPALLLTIAIIALLFLLTVIKTNHDFESIKTVSSHAEKEETISYKEFFKRHRIFLFMSIALVGVYFGYLMIDDMMILVVEDIGGTSNDLGRMLAMKALLEVPTIFFYDKIEEKINVKILLKISVICFALKMLATYLCRSLTMMYVTQLLQLISFALILPSGVSYIHQIMDKKEAIRGQSMFVMATSLGSVLSGAIGGSISQYYSVKTMLMLGTIVAAISAIAFCVLLDRNR